MLDRCKRTGRWIAERLKDLVYDPANNRLDNGRVLAFTATAALLVGEAHNIRLGQAIDLGPGGLGGGLAAVLGAAVVYVYKDRARTGGGE